ncbi:hypothetical protein OGAPHI_005764 [Ogataea philodendri]|uniref:Uncharacterized protein n=1 Tax=Ogataea philodendri TaxID=1378263 RepID=A0A9P8NZR8_9ASCO|nr:uncharacterized protein OGAPHI_005764 [Ogataea philodendri]KAH3662512.1 hypothetical protein OGAPHI_005764 [Ogataea philodendri]
MFSEESSLTRSRSNSESQFKSTRAEKRLGRLFKQPSTSTPSSKMNAPGAGSSSTSLVTAGSGASSRPEGKQTAVDDTKLQAGRGLRSLSQSAIPTTSTSSLAPTHSNNTSVSSMNSGAPRKTSLVSQSNGADPKLSTLKEVHAAGGTGILDLTDVMKLARKTRYVYMEFLTVLKHLGITVNTSSSLFNSFSNLFEFLGRRLQEGDREYIQDSFRVQLVAQTLEVLKDLRKVTEHLSFPSQLISSTAEESIRMAYFSVFSLVVELTGACKILVPSFAPKTHARNGRSIQLSAAPLVTPKLRSQPPKVNRAPPANPQHPQTIPVPARQPSIHRPPVKLDTSVSSLSRQDSDLSLVSSVEHSTDNEKLYEIINFTTQAAQGVFTHLNDALAKSAISTAQNTQNAPPDDQDLPNFARKVKELTTQCMSSMEQTKRIKGVLNSIRASPRLDEDQQKKLYEETNFFLKSIISFLAATKGALQDIPALNEVRGALSNLTRATKELTIRLETSVLKQSVTNATEQPPLSSIPSVANFQNTHAAQELNTRTVGSPSLADAAEFPQQGVKSLQTSGLDHVAPLPVTTPLVASIGPTAASVVLPLTSPRGASVGHPEHNPFDKLGELDPKRVT